MTNTQHKNTTVKQAYLAYVAEHGRTPTVRALRERAGCSTETAARWLREQAPVDSADTKIPPVPGELSSAVHALWVTAYREAHRLTRAQHHADLLAAHTSEMEAIQGIEQLQDQLQAHIETELKDLL